MDRLVANGLGNQMDLSKISLLFLRNSYSIRSSKGKIYFHCD